MLHRDPEVHYRLVRIAPVPMVTVNCQAVTLGGQWGQLDLNVMLPMMARNMLESIRILANVSRVFVDKGLAGLEANRERAEGYVEGSMKARSAWPPR